MDCRGLYLGPARGARRSISPVARALLDIAGGSGVYACAFVAHHPHLRATVLEKPPVDAVARRAIAERGFADRVDVVAGDMLRGAAARRGYDVHLISNVLHDWDVPRCGALLARSFAALAPGGLLIVHDAHLERRQDRPAAGRRLLGAADARDRRPLLFGRGDVRLPRPRRLRHRALHRHRRRSQPRRRDPTRDEPDRRRFGSTAGTAQSSTAADSRARQDSAAATAPWSLDLCPWPALRLVSGPWLRGSGACWRSRVWPGAAPGGTRRCSASTTRARTSIGWPAPSAAARLGTTANADGPRLPRRSAAPLRLRRPRPGRRRRAPRVRADRARHEHHRDQAGRAARRHRARRALRLGPRRPRRHGRWPRHGGGARGGTRARGARRRRATRWSSC